jgi:hypothetical protein
LPDGIFSNKKSHFGLILEGLAIEDVGIFYGHWAYFTANWFIWGLLVYFSPFWFAVPRKIWQSWIEERFVKKSVFIP